MPAQRALAKRRVESLGIQTNPQRGEVWSCARHLCVALKALACLTHLPLKLQGFGNSLTVYVGNRALQSFLGFSVLKKQYKSGEIHHTAVCRLSRC